MANRFPGRRVFPVPPAVFIAILVGATLGVVAVLVWVDDPLWRAAGGLLLVALIVGTAMELGAVRALQMSAVPPAPPRRFHRLRARVEELLEEIRRLNWVAVIGPSGFQHSAAARDERATIERRLSELLEEIKTAVGEASPREGEGGGA